MRKTALFLLLFACFSAAVAQPVRVPVFESGREGHKSYRIPAIVSLPGGRLLAFAEGRVNGSGDFGDINIVLKTSSDKGTTWTPLKTVVDADSLQAGNPAPVVDLTDPLYPGGRVFLFYNTGNNHEGEVRKGNGLREVWFITSADGGNNWSDPINITSQVHRPQQPRVNAGYNFPEDWRSYANTPGHAIQFRQGKYKDRIFVAANHSAGPPKQHSEDYFIHGYYTDDHGKSFRLGETINHPGGNESMAVELRRSGLMMNSRNQQGETRARIVSISTDGGQTWDTTCFDTRLIDPVNQGSILAINPGSNRSVLAFCNAADTAERNHLTVRISFDEGKTWKKGYLIDKAGSGSGKDHSAYSDLVELASHTLGILYERNGYAQIVFTTLRWR